jgi:hypothetical protein
MQENLLLSGGPSAKYIPRLATKEEVSWIFLLHMNQPCPLIRIFTFLSLPKIMESDIEVVPTIP